MPCHATPCLHTVKMACTHYHTAIYLVFMFTAHVVFFTPAHHQQSRGEFVVTFLCSLCACLEGRVPQVEGREKAAPAYSCYMLLTPSLPMFHQPICLQRGKSYCPKCAPYQVKVGMHCSLHCHLPSHPPPTTPALSHHCLFLHQKWKERRERGEGLPERRISQAERERECHQCNGFRG